MEEETARSDVIINHIRDELFAELHVVCPTPKVMFDSLESLAKREVIRWSYKSVGLVHNKVDVNLKELEFSLLQQWGVDVEAKISVSENNLIMVDTTLQASLDKIVEGGCWTFHNPIIMFNKWDPPLFLHNEFIGSFKTTPVYAKVKDAPITRSIVGNVVDYSSAAILPVVQKQHQLLVTLLLCNACAMEALPLYLDKIFNPFVAIVLSVTFVLAFGEVIPQAICTRYGLSVGANLVWLVRILMIVCYPIVYPIGKILDYVLGHNDVLFRRAQLKALVSIHSQEAGKGGELTHDETTIISGALDLTEKTAEEAMTPIESTFSLDVDSKLDWEAIGKILARGHSRVPVYSGNPRNIIGLLLIKSLLTIRAETETPVSAVSIRRIPRVPADMPLYDILNEFQKGSSHMAAVVKAIGKDKNLTAIEDGEITEEINITIGNSKLTTPLLPKQDENSEYIIEIEKVPRPVNINKQISFSQEDATTNGLLHLPDDVEDGEVIGIITLEDVFEELLQEEIVDETDEYVDVHKRIRVAAAAAASLVARAPSSRRLIGQKGGGQNKPGQTPKKSGGDDPSKQGSLGEPLLVNKK